MLVQCKCGSTNYRTETAGPHVKAVCNECNSYIKFLPQPLTENSIMEFGKYKGSKLNEIPISYFSWMFQNGKLNGALKNYVRELLNSAI